MKTKSLIICGLLVLGSAACGGMAGPSDGELTIPVSSNKADGLRTHLMYIELDKGSLEMEVGGRETIETRVVQHTDSDVYVRVQPVVIRPHPEQIVSISVDIDYFSKYQWTPAFLLYSRIAGTEEWLPVEGDSTLFTKVTQCQDPFLVVNQIGFLDEAHGILPEGPIQRSETREFMVVLLPTWVNGEWENRSYSAKIRVDEMFKDDWICEKMGH